MNIYSFKRHLRLLAALGLVVSFSQRIFSHDEQPSVSTAIYDEASQLTEVELSAVAYLLKEAQVHVGEACNAICVLNSNDDKKKNYPYPVFVETFRELYSQLVKRIVKPAESFLSSDGLSEEGRAVATTIFSLSSDIADKLEQFTNNMETISITKQRPTTADAITHGTQKLQPVIDDLKNYCLSFKPKVIAAADDIVAVHSEFKQYRDNIESLLAKVAKELGIQQAGGSSSTISVAQDKLKSIEIVKHLMTQNKKANLPTTILRDEYLQHVAQPIDDLF